MPRPWPPLPDYLLVDENRDVIRFLATPELSAHSDVTEVLERALAPLSEASLFCPDRNAFAYVVAFRNDNRIFAIAYGMSAIALRLSQAHVADAIAEGAQPVHGLDSGWIAFDAFASDVQPWVQRAFGE